MAITLIDTADSGFRFTRSAYQAEVIQLASSFSARLEGADEGDDNTDFEFIYDAVVSSPWIIYTIGHIAVLAYSEVRYPEVLSVRDSAIWAMCMDISTYPDVEALSDIRESLELLYDDYLTRNGYKYAY